MEEKDKKIAQLEAEIRRRDKVGRFLMCLNVAGAVMSVFSVIVCVNMALLCRDVISKYGTAVDVIELQDIRIEQQAQEIERWKKLNKGGHIMWLPKDEFDRRFKGPNAWGIDWGEKPAEPEPK